jgi:hypothetical protein
MRKSSIVLEGGSREANCYIMLWFGSRAEGVGVSLA